MKFFQKGIATAILIGAISALTITPALAFEGPPIRGRAVASSSALPSNERYQLREYFDAHPQILQVLAKDPSLLQKPTFLKRHGQLKEILATNPRIEREFEQHPETMINEYRAPEQHHTAHHNAW